LIFRTTPTHGSRTSAGPDLDRRAHKEHLMSDRRLEYLLTGQELGVVSFWCVGQR
jgi:hypothetical protein